MTTIEEEREMQRPMTKDEKEQYRLNRLKVVSGLLLYGQDPGEYTRAQAVGIVDHLQEYVRGNETSFVRYFVISNAHHISIHENFWAEARERFPMMETIQDAEEPRIKRIVFSEVGVGLLARTDYDAAGQEFAIHYEAYGLTDRPPEIIGKIATGLAMS